MSYDLAFWRYKPGINQSPHDVCDILYAGRRVEGLEDLPIETIKQRISDSFFWGWTRLDENTWDGLNSAFQLYTTDQFLNVTCYELDTDCMNTIIDVLQGFDCPLYDPQIARRFK